MLSIGSAFPESSVATPRWAMMWEAAVVIFFACKWLTCWRTPRTGVPISRQLGYILTWPGMDSAAFFNTQLRPKKPNWKEWLFAGVKTVFGVVILYLVVRRAHLVDAYWLGWMGMVGIAFCLHFGSFHLLSCAWRAGRG